MMNKTFLIAVFNMLIASCSPSVDYNLCPEGFSWDDYVFACTAALDESQREAAKIVISPISMSPVTIEKVETLRCPGCFIVYIKTGTSGTSNPIKLVNWKVAGPIDSFEDCIAEGNPITGSDPKQCTADGKVFTEWQACTTAESAPQACTDEYAPVCAKIILNMGDTIYQEYPNSCSACTAMKAVSYSPGTCADNGCSQNQCRCAEGYKQFDESCDPECYYSSPPCLAPSIDCIKTFSCP